jgi:hypothetical protein
MEVCMATRENAATAKDATPTPLPAKPILRANAPQLRTADAILEKNEQILDGLERGSVTPKMGEQMGQCIKTPIALARLEMAFLRMIQHFGRKAPVPRSPLLRTTVGLKEDIAPTDGDYVRGLLVEK